MFVSFLGSSVISSRSDLLQLLLRVRCASANRERRGVLGHDRKGRSTSASHLLVDARGQGCSETYTRGLWSRDYLQARYSSWRAGRLSRGSWSFPRSWATRAVIRARRITADPGWQALFWWRMRWLDQPLRVRYTHLLVSTATLVERAPRTPRSRLLSRRGRRRTYRIATRPSRQALNTRSISEETHREMFATVYVRAIGYRS